MTADKRIFSPAKWQRSEMPYYFSCILALLFTEQSVYFRPYIKHKLNYNPVDFAKEAYQFQHKLLKNHVLTV